MVSKSNSFRHYLMVFLLFMAVFAAGSGIVNLITTKTISIGEILAILVLLATLALFMNNSLKKRKQQKGKK